MLEISVDAVVDAARSLLGTNIREDANG
jgi:hypothetical protein